jgi:hypothetical protein
MSREAAAAAIAEKLGETDATPLKQIDQIIEALGEARALELLEQTMQIEAQGGMTVANGSRRRSPGGVFFHLVRKDLSREWKQRIFYWQPDAPGKAAKQDAPPPEASAPKVRRPRIIEVSKDLAPKGKRRASSPPKAEAITKESARERIKQVLAGLPAGEQRELLLELIADLRPASE